MYLANTSTFQDMPYSMSMIFLLRDIQQGTQAQALINRAIIYYLDLLPVDRISPLGESIILPLLCTAKTEGVLQLKKFHI